MISSQFPIHVLTKPDLSIATLPKIWQIEKAPAQLFIQGIPDSLKLLDRLPRFGFAVVGTRTPQLRSRELVRKHIHDLKHTPLIILSGFARGIDTEAHLAALEAGLPTIAVLGTPLNVLYPDENGELRKRILQAGGLIVSEFPADRATYRGDFKERNRIIAGWADATWVVEAGYKSGALSTARYASNHNEYACFATPCYPGDPALQGNQKLLDKREAQTFWGVHSLGTVWSFLAGGAPSRRRRSSLQMVLDPDQHFLSNWIRQTCSARGSVSVEQALQVCLENQWSAERFFNALHAALAQGFICDQNGFLAPRG